MTIARSLHLAATPTFVVMALLTVAPNDGMSGALCVGADHMTLAGMTPMYLLMAVFHAAPWLKLLAPRQSAGHASSEA